MSINYKVLYMSSKIHPKNVPTHPLTPLYGAVSIRILLISLLYAPGITSTISFLGNDMVGISYNQQLPL
jgi:hypothetical protein